jgi:hypothetical protein
MVALELAQCPVGCAASLANRSPRHDVAARKRKERWREERGERRGERREERGERREVIV